MARLRPEGSPSRSVRGRPVRSRGRHAPGPVLLESLPKRPEALRHGGPDHPETTIRDPGRGSSGNQQRPPRRTESARQANHQPGLRVPLRQRRPGPDHGHPRTSRTRPTPRTDVGSEPQNGPTFMPGGPNFNRGTSYTNHLTRPRWTAPTHVGVDEKAAGRGQDYITIVSDLDAGTVEFIADERRQASLDGYYARLTTEQWAGIEAVAMDMWEPFAASTRAHLTDADSKIVFDRYHLMGYLTGAVDTVRKQENRALSATGDKSLAGSKYLWLYSYENLPAKHTDRFTFLRSGDLKTARAWAIKESLRHFWSYKRRGWAAKHFKHWYFWATHSRLKPIIDAAKTLKRHEAGLLSYFAHPITNAGAEGLNSRIQAIRVSARGYRNREHFKTAIYFHLGGLQLYPATP